MRHSARFLSGDTCPQILEAARLLRYSTLREYDFCYNIAEIYGCKPLKTEGDNLYNFLLTLYHYGIIQGIRARACKAKRMRYPDSNY